MPPINNNDIKLMLAMIASTESLKTDNEKLAQIVGGGVTANAIRQRVQKIKVQAKAVLAGEELDLSATGGKTKAPATPSKRKAMGTENEEDDEVKPIKKFSPSKATVTPVKGRGGIKLKDEKHETLIKTEKYDKADENALDALTEEV